MAVVALLTVSILSFSTEPTSNVSWSTQTFEPSPEKKLFRNFRSMSIFSNSNSNYTLYVIHNVFKFAYLLNKQQLWNADLAVESIKDTFPAEAEQLKTILREVEDKMNVLRIGTKKWVAKINLTIAVSMFPSEDLMAALQVNITQTQKR